MAKMKLSTSLNIVDLINHPGLLRKWFRGESWRAWRVFLAALFGLPLTPEDLLVYQRHTGRQTPPKEQAREAWLVVGRRGGKSIISALAAIYLAFFRDYRKILAPGEVGTIMVIAADRRQARTVLRYIDGFIDAVPALARMVVKRTKEAIELDNRVMIEIQTASFRAVRGYTVVACIADEVAFWRTDEAANPDTEILNGLRPGMATIPGAVLLAISSPYARRGELWKAHKDHYGKDGDPVLVWQAETTAMNPAVDRKLIADAFIADEIAAASEYGAQFRRDIEGFVSQEIVDRCVVEGRHELPPVGGVGYLGFCDPSGGVQDSMTLAVSHHADGKAILDAVREVRPPFSPDAVAKEFSDLLKSYGLHSVHGDRYGGEWPRERFAVHGVAYEPSEKTKSEIYLAALPLLNSERAELLDHKRLRTQLTNLERRTSRGGKDSVDHGPGLHDDICNSVCGALLMALEGVGSFKISAHGEYPRPDWNFDAPSTGGGREPASLAEVADRQQNGGGRDDPFSAW